MDVVRFFLPAILDFTVVDSFFAFSLLVGLVPLIIHQEEGYHNIYSQIVEDPNDKALFKSMTVDCAVRATQEMFCLPRPRPPLSSEPPFFCCVFVAENGQDQGFH